MTKIVDAECVECGSPFEALVLDATLEDQPMMCGPCAKPHIREHVKTLVAEIDHVEIEIQIDEV